MTRLAFEVRDGVNADGHCLEATHAISIHSAQQQAHLCKPINESLQGHLVQFFMLIFRQDQKQLTMGIAGIGMR